MDRVLRNTSADIDLNIYDADAQLADADATVNVTVRDSAGTIVFGPVAAAHVTTGIYKVQLAPQALLDVLECTWTFTLGTVAQELTTQVEIVGGFLFSLGELRGFDAALADDGRYPASFLRAARCAVEERFEEEMVVHWSPHGARDIYDGDDTDTLLLDHVRPLEIIAGSEGPSGQTPTAYTSTDLANFRLYRPGIVRRKDASTFTRGVGNISLFYEHGVKLAPYPVRRAGLILAREILVEAPGPRRTITESTEVGIIRYALAGRDGPVGIPEVDAVIVRFSMRAPQAR